MPESDADRRDREEASIPPERIECGDVVQIDHTHDGFFGECFLVVTKVRSWWVAGYITTPGRRRVYYRIGTEAIKRIGSVG